MATPADALVSDPGALVLGVHFTVQKISQSSANEDNETSAEMNSLVSRKTNKGSPLTSSRTHSWPRKKWAGYWPSSVGDPRWTPVRIASWCMIWECIDFLVKTLVRSYLYRIYLDLVVYPYLTFQSTIVTRLIGILQKSSMLFSDTNLVFRCFYYFVRILN